MRGFWQQRLRRGEFGLVFAIFFGAFVVAVVATTITGYFSSPERWEYSEIAENILRGHGASYDYLGTTYYFYGPVVYPALLAAVLWASNGTETAVVVLQTLLFALTCLVIYLIARTFFRNAEAGLAAFLAAFHPGSLIYVGKLHPQVVDVFLIVLSFLLLLQTAAISAPTRVVGGGLVAGLAALSRGTMVPFFSLWAARFLWKERNRLSQAVPVLVAFAVGSALIFAPVLLRGYLLYGEIILLRTDTGVNLWYGNHPGASGTSYTLSPSPVAVISGLPSELSARIVGTKETDQDRVLRGAALDFARNDPAAALLLFLKKIYFFWWFSPHSGLLYPATWLTAYKIYYAVILCFAVIGLLVSLRSTQPSVRTVASLFLLLAGSVSVTQALFYVEGRHRWQIEPVLLVFTATGFLYVLRRFSSSRFRP